jgi:hypothetical protein
MGVGFRQCVYFRGRKNSGICASLVVSSTLCKLLLIVAAVDVHHQLRRAAEIVTMSTNSYHVSIPQALTVPLSLSPSHNTSSPFSGLPISHRTLPIPSLIHQDDELSIHIVSSGVYILSSSILMDGWLSWVCWISTCFGIAATMALTCLCATTTTTTTNCLLIIRYLESGTGIGTGKGYQGHDGVYQ